MILLNRLRAENLWIAWTLLIAGAVLAAGTPAIAGEIETKAGSQSGDPGELITDRPDYTESTETVATGFAQLELGLQTSAHALHDGNTYTFGGPFPLLRIGLNHRLELRLGTDGMQVESGSEGGILYRSSGMSDLEAGIKLRLMGEGRRLPSVSVIGALSLPVGGSHFSSGGRDAILQVCWSKDLAKGFDIGGNFNLRRDTNGAVLLEHGYSLTTGHKLPGGLRGFWEIYRISPIPGDERAHWIADSGISRRLGRNVQVDVEIGHTVVAATPCWLIGFGLAVRGPVGSLF